MIERILVWNCRETRNKEFLTHAKMLVNQFTPNVLALLETKAHSNKAEGIFCSLGFSKYIVSDGRGLAGGIWVAWKEGDSLISVIQNSFQFIQLKIMDKYKGEWLLTIIYMNPNLSNRDECHNSL